MPPLRLALLLTDPGGRTTVVSGRAWREGDRLAFQPDGAGAAEPALLPEWAADEVTPVPAHFRSLVGGAHGVLALSVPDAARHRPPGPSCQGGPLPTDVPHRPGGRPGL